MVCCHVLRATCDVRRAKGSPAAQPLDLTTFYLVLLKRPPAPAAAVSAEQGAQIQKAHIAHLEKLGNEGYGMAAGPFADDGEIRGINVLKANSAEPAGHRRVSRELDRRGPLIRRGDPMVKVGRLVVELHPWMTAKGVLPLK